MPKVEVDIRQHELRLHINAWFYATLTPEEACQLADQLLLGVAKLNLDDRNPYLVMEDRRNHVANNA